MTAHLNLPCRGKEEWHDARDKQVVMGHHVAGTVMVGTAKLALL